MNAPAIGQLEVVDGSLDSKAPGGDIRTRWDRHRFEIPEIPALVRRGRLDSSSLAHAITALRKVRLTEDQMADLLKAAAQSSEAKVRLAVVGALESSITLPYGPALDLLTDLSRDRDERVSRPAAEAARRKGF